MTLNDFNRHLDFFNFLKIKTYFVDDLYPHLKGDKKLPFNSISIQFDDGYLDSFTFAFPLLRKYKLKATIWVNPDFVDFRTHSADDSKEQSEFLSPCNSEAVVGMEYLDIFAGA